jgi:nucleotide-binding universal stress UspA family protein
MARERSWCEDAAVPPRYRHVLLAFDGSPDADLALAHAVAMAQVYRARLTIVAVVPPPPLLAWQAPGGMRGIHDEEQSELAEQLRKAADGVPDDLSVTTRLLDGDPAREILHAAGDGDHDVIVMGSRGRGRVSAALLGSVSNHVMHDAEVPVVVIHRPGSDGGPDLAA